MELQEGDQVKTASYIAPYEGVMVIEYPDNLITTLTGIKYWFCTGVEDKDHFESYPESELIKV